MSPKIKADQFSGGTDNVLHMGSDHIGQDTLLIVDPRDLSKKYAKKMEYLAEVCPN